METIIVSRHPAAIEFIARHLEGAVWEADGISPYAVRIPHDGWTEEIPILANATQEDVAGKHVYGNLPLHLAVEAEMVTAIQFSDDPPRGAEYTLDDMDEAGAYLSDYVVCRPPYLGVGRGLRNRVEEMLAADAEHYRTQQDRAQDAAWEDMRNA